MLGFKRITIAQHERGLVFRDRSFETILEPGVHWLFGLLARIDDPAKQWKFNVGDIGERKLWDQYMTAYQDMIRATATDEAPWYVVPADHKWFTRLVVASAIIERVEAIDPKFPTLSEQQLHAIASVRASLAKD